MAPRSVEFDAADWDDFDRVLERALTLRSASVRRQIATFLHLLDGLARLRYGTALARLRPAPIRALLDRLGRSALLPLRRGVWGVRTLAFMGVYGRLGARTALGYRSHADGWSARGGGRAWPGRAGRAPPERTTLLAGPDPHG